MELIDDVIGGLQLRESDDFMKKDLKVWVTYWRLYHKHIYGRFELKSLKMTCL